MLQTRFGWRRERAKAHPPRTTAKPRLEMLEDRTVPSGATLNAFPAVQDASPPPARLVAAATSYMGTRLEQLTQTITTAEQNLLDNIQTRDQKVIQEVADVFLQLQRILGTAPSAVPQFDSGAGNGVMPMAHENTPTTKLHTLTSGSGSDSGSGPQVYFETSSTQIPESTGCMTNVTLAVMLSAPSTQTVSVYAVTHDGTATAGTDYTAEDEEVIFQPGQTVQNVSIPILDDGDDEDAGSSQYFSVELSAPQNATLGTPKVCAVNIVENPPQQATDTLVWNPCKGSKDLASDPTNWYDQRLGQNLSAGMMGPNPSSPIIFDANSNDTPHNDSPIIWDKSVTVASITLKQYTSQQTINSGVKVESNGANGTSLGMDINSKLDLNYTDTSSKFQIDNNATITGMYLYGPSPGQGLFKINGGTTTIAQAHYNESFNVQFDVAQGATLNDQGGDTLNLNGSNDTLSVEGTMLVRYGTGQGSTLIGQSAGQADNYINVNGGSLEYLGSGNTEDDFGVPVLVQGGGSFIVTSADNQPAGANLTVQGIVPNQADNASVYVTGDNSVVQLSKAAFFQTESDYYYLGE